MLIKNGMVVLEYGCETVDILIENSIIKEIGKDLESDDVIDAKGKYVLPGGVDVHTHMNLDVGIAVSQDDFYTGTVAAACGGTTTIVDHIAFGPIGCSLDYQVKKYHNLAEDKAVIDYGFHGVIQHIDDDVLSKMETMIDDGITSYKIYMTYDYCLNDDDIYTVLKRAKELGIIIAVHPENDEVIKKRHEFVKKGLTAPIYHERSRPAECEAEAIGRIIEINKSAGDANLYVVHLSNQLGMNKINEAKLDRAENVFVETCPQYLFLNDEYYLKEDGIKYILSPPLREKKNNDLLWQDIIAEDIDTIGTDHCPFDYKLKVKMGSDDFTKCPNGLPGVETRIPLMFSKGVLNGKISVNHFADICSTNPAKLFGMYPKKGVIKEGSDADIVIIDPNKNTIIRHDDLHENVDFTPYEGIEIKCSIDTVISRGDIIVKNNQFIGDKKRGKFIKRNKPNTNLM